MSATVQTPVATPVTRSVPNHEASGASAWNLAPAWIVMAIFFGSYLVFLYTSFLHQVPGQAASAGPMTLANYARFIQSPEEWAILGKTIWISIELTVIASVIGFPVAYVMVRCESPRLRQFIMLSLVVTFLSGTVTRAYAWQIILGNTGLINSILRKIGVIDSPIKMLYNTFGVFIALLQYVMPFFILTLLGPLKNVPRSLEESAINLGASRLQAFLRITLPLALPGIVAASALTFAVSLSSFLFPLVLGGGRVRLISNEIYDQIFVSFNIPFAAATATIFLLVSLGCVWAFSLLQRFSGRRVNRAGAPH